MHTLELALAVLSPVLVGTASFLYNDGHDHELVAGLAGAVGWCATALSRVVGMPAPNPCDPRYAPDSHLWRVQNHCHKSPGFLRTLFDAFVWPGIKEVAFAIAAGLAGLLLAKVTPRRPRDGRKAKILLEDLLEDV